MTTTPREDVITKAEITKNDANYVRGLEERLIALQTANEALGIANTGLLHDFQTAQERIDALTKQLPDEMQDCTIRFKECTKCQRGWLTATNWVQHPCPHCERDSILATNRVLSDLNDRLVRQNSNLINQLRSEQQTCQLLHSQNSILVNQLNEFAATPTDEFGPIGIHDRDPEALQRNIVQRSYASLTRLEAALHRQRQYRQRHNPPPTLEEIIEHSTGHIAVDNLGPLTKGDLDASALRDGRLVRSEESRKNINEIQARARAEALTDKASKVSQELTDPINDARDFSRADLDHRREVLDRLNVSNIVGGPNEAELSAERRKIAEQTAADVLNDMAPLPYNSDETSNIPDKQTEDR